ncbi:rhomboid family intramembrane serine protease [Hansschlegelia beijingensis]|uniref:rhomboid family intramembrane serine protease n=1 Tax=Hansschlegelia beijingensis TaxID=1133344 RepID=UPI00382B3A1F
MPREYQPAFNAPRVITVTLVVLAAIHLVRFFLSDEADLEVLLRFAFIPARYDPSFPYADELLGGEGAKVWTFVTYAFLHGNLTHLVVNGVWLLAFGSALAWRFGTSRFLVFSALTAAAGAATHLALHYGEATPVIGASAAISGHTAAAMRFMFESGGPLDVFRRGGREAFLIPAEPLRTSLRRPQALIFLLVWFGGNALAGFGSTAIGLGDASIAWEAHIGGFIAGLLLFPLFDPVRRGVRPSSQETFDVLPPSRHPPHDDGTGAAGRP